jgi:hypothetical protein
MAPLSIKKDDLPLVFSLMLGFILWGLQHIVEEVLKTPIIEYSIKTEGAAPRKVATFTFTNLSRERKYDDFKILFLGSLQDANIINGVYIPANSFIDQDFEAPYSVDSSTQSAFFEIKKLQPRASFKIQLLLRRDSVPSFRYTSDSTLIIKEHDCETYIAKNEEEIILILIGVFVVALGLFIILKK